MKSIFATAALAAACHAAFASGIYRESFNDGHAQFWDPRPAEAFSIETSGSGNPFYRGSADVTRRGGVVSQVSTLMIPPPRNFRYTVRVADNLIRPTYLVFRATADFGFDRRGRHGSGYAFGIDCISGLNSFYFYKAVDGRFSVIQTWKRVPSLKCSGDIDDADELRVTMKDDLIVLSINGEGVYRYRDPDPITSGRLGFYNISDDYQPTHSDFDHVVVGRAPDTLDDVEAPSEAAEGGPLQADDRGTGS